MSYILDALKKSEQERGQGSVPDVQTVHSSSLNYGNEKNTYWPYILITAVILNLLAIVYFIFDKDKPSVSATEVIQNKIIKQNTPALATTDNIQTIASEDIKDHTVMTPSITVSEAEQDDIAQQSTLIQTPVYNQTVAETKADDTANYDHNETATKNSIDDNSGVIEFYDLPESIKQQLPAIIISAHVYSSNPVQRSIVINNNFLEEGEYVLDDLILHEITADGAIFNYNDTLFHYGVVSSWQ